MISICKRTKKCASCGKIAPGLLFFNDRLERLAPVFLCGSCLKLASDAGKAPERTSAASQTAPKSAEAGKTGSPRRRKGAEE